MIIVYSLCSYELPIKYRLSNNIEFFQLDMIGNRRFVMV